MQAGRPLTDGAIRSDLRNEEGTLIQTLHLVTRLDHILLCCVRFPFLQLRFTSPSGLLCLLEQTLIFFQVPRWSLCI